MDLYKPLVLRGPHVSVRGKIAEIKGLKKKPSHT